MDRSIYCLVKSSKQANNLVECLLDENFDTKEISVLCPNKKDFNKPTFKTEKHSKAPEEGVAGTTAGGVLGGTLGQLAGIGVLSIPGVGPFIAAGPIKGALSGSATSGLLHGALTSFGVPEIEAKKYETALKQGSILISVRAFDDQKLARATEIVKKNGGEEISTTREKTRSSY